MAPRISILDIAGSESSYYAPAVISSARETIHISGQVGMTRHGLVPPDYESQVYLALLNIRRILTTAEASVSHIVKLILYIVSSEVDQRKHTRIIQQFLGSHRPAITLVPLSQLSRPGWLIEIDAEIARDPSPNSKLPRSLSTSIPEVDVVIVGAGLAGLSAADRILKAGHTCVVLEARNRVGGRTWSQKSLSGNATFDVGAAWINDTNQSRMISLARAFGAELVEQNTEGNIILQDTDNSLKYSQYGELPDFPDSIKSLMAHIRDTAEADCQKLSVYGTPDKFSAELDSMTFLAYIKKRGADDKAVSLATIWTRAMLGQDPVDISALFFLQYCKAGGGLLQMRSDRTGGGQHLRIRQGTQMFAINIAKSLPKDIVHLNAPVSTVTNLSPQANVVSCLNDGPTFRARKVLSAVPIPVLKDISFSPPLPPTKRLLISSYRYGYYQKVLVTFRSPFWVPLGFCGMLQSFTGPACVTRDTSVAADNKYELTCFVGGSVGLAWSKLPTLEARRDAILEQLEHVFGDGELVRSQYLDMTGLKWMDERWSGYGCPSPAPGPGVISAIGEDALTSTTGDVHFAGTETSDVWRGYMEGAVRSGEREAERISKGLNSISAKI